MQIGFIGLGNMGNPMAAHLIEAGFALTVHDKRREAAENLIGLGAQWADSPQAVAQVTDTIFTSLPGPMQIEEVLLGMKGVIAGAKSGSTWIDMSTNSPDLIQYIADFAAEKGIATLDAPVSGEVDCAQQGALKIFVSGEKEIFEKHLPLFEVMGEKVFYTGALGTGIAAKLLTNLLWFVNTVAVGEALVLGAKAGIELPLLWDIIKSSVGNSWVAENSIPTVFRGDYDPAFSLQLSVKDLRLINNLSSDLDVPLELGSLVQQIFMRAKNQYGPDQGETSVVRLLEDAAGVALRAPDFE